MGGPEQTGDAGLGFTERTFDNRRKSRITGSRKNTCFGKETVQRPRKLAV